METQVMDEESDGVPWRWLPRKRLKAVEDPLFEDGDELCEMAFKQIALGADKDNETNPSMSNFSCQMSKCGKTFTSVVEYEMHYSTVHRHVCSECRRHFPSGHLLDVHLLEWHDAMFELMAAKQKMYQCLVQTCPQKFESEKVRKRHLVEEHKYPANFRFHRTRRPTKAQPAKPTLTKDPMDATMATDSAKMEVESAVDRPDKEKLTEVTEDSKKSSVSASGRRFVYSVPKTICFGQGSQRGFHRPPGGKKRGKPKHWHQEGAPQQSSKVNIEDVDMKAMKNALGDL